MDHGSVHDGGQDASGRLNNRWTNLQRRYLDFTSPLFHEICFRSSRFGFCSWKLASNKMILATDSKSLFFLRLAALVPKGLKMYAWPSAITARKWTMKG
ncbi:hypothetical protein ZIOFF_021839 [Zingiber officinale]|uniref:Uncharacterized protein n=1 Tax=Zingiber officinale TaxID=94328 RepID=A0A8J5H289_ZINOF|nr:hypothetical protein ZIOFF_021839 [Zingiber officinale]